jgi:DNA polymerase-3 subunit epsilon
MTSGIDFIAVDVETANADLASICQIGIANVRSGRVMGVSSYLIDPEDFFDQINISIHGIDETMIEGAPRFIDVFGEIDGLIAGVAASHTAFDRAAITRAAEKYEIHFRERVWLDTARVARRAWPEKYAKRGYGLANVASDLGIDFRHHDAGEDARAAAEILIRACEEASLDIDGWLRRVRQPISPVSSAGSFERTQREGDPEGPLFGEVVVFTGALQMPRREAADLAAAIGCSVESGVTKKTTLLVVGDQDVRRLAGHEKSSKHRKAESLIETGQPIRILRESDFEKLVSQS